jgi:hypothetical protein
MGWKYDELLEEGLLIEFWLEYASVHTMEQDSCSN